MSVPGRYQLCEAIWKGDLDGVKKWLSPENMDRANWRGWTVVVFACQAGNVDVVRYMKSQGANMTIRDKQGRTLLHHVRQSVELVELLLASGLNVNQKDGLGDTPLHTCDPDERDVVRRLLEAGADIHATNNVNLTPLGKFYNHDVASLLLEYWDGKSVVCKRKNCSCRSTVFVCNNNRSKSTIYRRHVVKNICAKMSVSPENNICNPHPFMAETAFISSFFGSFKKLCDEELKRMETEKCAGVCYASVWNRRQCALRNPAVQEAMTPDHCVWTFPIYGEALRKRYVEGVRWLALVDKAVDSFEVHVPELLSECVAQVLEYLDISDLKILIVACGRRKTSSEESLKRSCEQPPTVTKAAKLV